MNSERISTILEHRLHHKMVIVGVGNRECSDDGAGVTLVEKLIPKHNLRPLVAGDFPEFHITEVIEEKPDVVMFVDTADLGSAPGSIAMIEIDQLPSAWGNTHQPSLAIIMRYVSDQAKADTFLLGIQPENVSHGNTLSTPVETTVQLLSDFLNRTAENNEQGMSGEKL